MKENITMKCYHPHKKTESITLNISSNSTSKQLINILMEKGFLPNYKVALILPPDQPLSQIDFSNCEVLILESSKENKHIEQDLKINFIHPSNGKVMKAALEVNITAEEAINELIANGFISPNLRGYNLVNTDGGKTLSNEESFIAIGLDNEAYLQIVQL